MESTKIHIHSFFKDIIVLHKSKHEGVSHKTIPHQFGIMINKRTIYLKEKLTDHRPRQQPSVQPGKVSVSPNGVQSKKARAWLLLLFQAKETTPKWACIL